MRDGKAGDVDVADREAGASLKQFQLRRVFAPRHRGGGEARHIDWNAQFAGDYLQAVDMVGMLVGDENRSDRFGVVARRIEALEGLFAGEAGID